MAVLVARAALLEQRREQEENRRRQRQSLLYALRIEVTTIHTAVDHSVKEFAMAAQDRQMYFVWPPLPVTTIEQSLQEAFLLGWTNEQLEELQNLRLRILHSNTLVNAKNNTLPWVEHSTVALAAKYANEELRLKFLEILATCEKILRWLLET